MERQKTNETKKTFERNHQMWTRDVNTDREASASSGFVACTDNIENSARVVFPGLNLSSEKRSCYRGAVVQEFFFFQVTLERQIIVCNLLQITAPPFEEVLLNK